MKKLFNILFILLFFVFFVGCETPPVEIPVDNIPKEYYEITFQTNGGTAVESQTILKGDTARIPKAPYLVGYNFVDWYSNEECLNEYDFTLPVTEKITLYALWDERKYTVVFDTYGLCDIESQLVLKNETVYKPDDPVSDIGEFLGWYNDLACTKIYDFSSPIIKDTTIYSSWINNDFEETNYYVKYNVGSDTWLNKEALFIDYMSDFYYFMLDNYEVDFLQYGIFDRRSFLDFCINWNANGQSDLYGVGNAFASYYLTQETDGLLENQPSTTFIGYCYQEGKYLDFIPFLMQFFAYWRTDEGYTKPGNHGNDFFFSPWASLVDTAKFFYFTSSTLQTRYSWFTSARVKDALDNIPGVLFNDAIFVEYIDEIIILPTIVYKDGYTFKGWYDNSNFTGDVLLSVNKATTVYAKFEKN